MYGNPYNPYLTNQMNGMFPQNNPGFTPPTPQNFQNPVPNMQPPSIRGRLVQSVEEIRPNEVPMDGSVSYFPQSAYLVDTIVGRIHPPAVPSWNVPNPYAVYYSDMQRHPCGQYN